MQETSKGVVAINDLASESIYDYAPTYSSLLELGFVRSQLKGQLLAKGILRGFIEIQQNAKRDWTEEEMSACENISIALSIIVLMD